MKVTLNIENDVELRNYIKDCIKGQVLAIVREEFHEIVNQEINRKLKGYNDTAFVSMFKEAMIIEIRRILYKEFNVDSWSDKWIVPIVSQKLTEYFDKKDNLIETMVKEKIKHLAQNI